MKWQLLHNACRDGNAEEVGRLLAGHVAVVRTRLRRGADPATPTHPSGRTPLWLAAASRLPQPAALQTVREFLNPGDINRPWRGAKPLIDATGQAGHFKIAGLLLASIADPNAGVSLLCAGCEFNLQHLAPALHKTTLLGQPALVSKLITLRTDPTARDATGLTPLDIAHHFNKPAAVRALAL